MLAQRGRQLKGRYAREGDPARKREYAFSAMQWYLEAARFADDKGVGSSYPWINAATTARLAGEPIELVQGYAREALKNAEREGRLPGSDHYWLDATRGEANLLLHDFTEARKCYGRA